jgi:uracil-DNA glycosylase
MNKKKELEKISIQISNCRICKRNKIGLPVPGEGNPNAKLMFIGEAPGKNGKYLRSLIQGIGLDDVKDVYITSPVKFLPKHGTPTPAEIAHGRIHLFEQIKIINPKIMVLMGSVAALGVLQEKIPTMLNHGRIIERDRRKYFLTIHPAAAIRFFKFRKVIESDFRKLRRLI